jgi:hypothetical protein
MMTTHKADERTMNAYSVKQMKTENPQLYKNSNFVSLDVLLHEFLVKF